MNRFATFAAAGLVVAFSSAAFAGTQWSATRAAQARQAFDQRAETGYALTGQTVRTERADRVEQPALPRHSQQTRLFNFSRSSN